MVNAAGHELPLGPATVCDTLCVSSHRVFCRRTTMGHQRNPRALAKMHWIAIIAASVGVIAHASVSELSDPFVNTATEK